MLECEGGIICDQNNGECIQNVRGMFKGNNLVTKIMKNDACKKVTFARFKFKALQSLTKSEVPLEENICCMTWNVHIVIYIGIYEIN